MPYPAAHCVLPLAWKKMNGPTIWRAPAGSTRRTTKPPRSRWRESITCRIVMGGPGDVFDGDHYVTCEWVVHRHIRPSAAAQDQPSAAAWLFFIFPTSF